MTNDEIPNDEGNPNDEILKPLKRVRVVAVRRADSSAIFPRIASRLGQTATGHSDFDIRASLGFVRRGGFVIRHSVRQWRIRLRRIAATLR